VSVLTPVLQKEERTSMLCVGTPARELTETDQEHLYELTQEDRDRTLPSRDLMWVPVKGKETEVWASRSPDGKRHYNVRREYVLHVSVWVALWSHVNDGVSNVFTTKFLSRYEAQLACESLENTFSLDPKEVEEENKWRQGKLAPSGWCFQGVFAGTSIWTYRSKYNPDTCYVIRHDMERRGRYELTIRHFVANKGEATLKIEVLGMFDSLIQSQKEVQRLIG
jgi:hypothetical protein